MDFTIEKVKWEWPEPVKSKDVYRDDEFVKTTTKKQAIEATKFLCKKQQGCTYTITVRRGRNYFTYYRHSMPCLGGWVKYRDSHGEKHYMNPYFPRDIRVAYPEGDTVLIGCSRPNMNNSLKHPYYDFILSQESPWVSAFGDRKTILFGDNYLILTNMDTDPTVFYSLMRLGGLYHHGVSNNQDPKAVLLVTKNTAADPRRLAGQKPIRTSGGTWKEGYGYTRPYNESIFKTKLPHKLEEFGKLGSYPNAPYTNEYFINTMKEKFGLTTENPNNTTPWLNDEKSVKTLVEAWDFFKEEAKELDD